ncbi:methyltransferase domain-containing protein [Murimonas intestini]|uniref:methyltransferase domain-containing protein n=1 Tax=Murimonas intestini TaxID=1337051 RepID=UPI0011DDD41C|nr:methyltransferase domain-containing protein [Murimonas intestini]
MDRKPFWEQTYRDKNSSTFYKGPTVDLEEFYNLLAPESKVLDVGCGEGRNSIFLAKHGHTVEAFDISEAGIDKARGIAEQQNVHVDFFVQDLALYNFSGKYDVILSHGVLHLPEKKIRDEFIKKMQENTNIGGYNFIGIFTNRLPATPDNAPFTKSLFAVGELPDKYAGWEILHHLEGTFKDSHPGGIHHEHAFERIIARKV